MNEKERLQLENELLMTCSKAQAINKYIDELEESSKLSELWCKSQQENQSLKDRIEKAIEYIENSYYSKNTINIDDIAMTTNKFLKIREILKGDKEC